MWVMCYEYNKERCIRYSEGTKKNIKSEESRMEIETIHIYYYLVSMPDLRIHTT